MTAQNIIDLWCSTDFLIIVCPALLIIILAVSCDLYQKFQDKKEYSISVQYNNKSITKLYSQFLERSTVFRCSMRYPDLNSYEEYLITFKGLTAQEVYQKIKEHLESIIEEYKNTGAYCESDNHAIANFLAEIRFAQDELCAVDRQKIDTKLSDFS